MKSYTVCVELHGKPRPLEWELLTELLSRHGLMATVDALTTDTAERVTVELPRKLFLGEFEISPPELAESVYALASTVRSVACVFVAETPSWSIKQ